MQTPRIRPLSPPYEPAVAAQLAAMMPAGVPPIHLFRTFAKNLKMTTALSSWGGYYLSDEFSLTLRDRELVIARVTARCRCEYEWGVHVAFFADAAKLDREQIASLAHGYSSDPCWTSERDRVIIAAVDALHDHAELSDDLWARTTTELSEQQVLDLFLVSGWYHGISYAANGARVALERGAPRFADFIPS